MPLMVLGAWDAEICLMDNNFVLPNLTFCGKQQLLHIELSYVPVSVLAIWQRVVSKTGSYYVVLDGLKLAAVLVPQPPPECWDHMHEPAHPDSFYSRPPYIFARQALLGALYRGRHRDAKGPWDFSNSQCLLMHWVLCLDLCFFHTKTLCDKNGQSLGWLQWSFKK